ncbi:MAG TPA: hypothetical protein PKD64_02330 [Pirellulaceae bacterium]|nr:hypothetical protein [Pirellulaceae bacterium]HMO91005.1 hypothetical protein [Pirellulaceae bacterium]HMP68120.1 hypothetical protein [Pirellulaceae bacterium]
MTRTRHVAIWGLFILALVANSLSICAQDNKFSVFKRNKEAFESDNIMLNERHGPWLIMCASFGGEEGLEQAKELVRELRGEFRLPAYLYAKNFDFSGEVAGLGVKAVQNANGEFELRNRSMRFLHQPNYEYAVLVGDFSNPDDAQTQKTLEKIKHLKPRCLEVSESVQTNQRFGVWREIQRQVSNNPTLRDKGPMRTAFVMPNPTIPSEYFQAKKQDKLVINMNKGLQYSLYKCPEPYSVKVATFRGELTYDAKKIEAAQKDFEQRLRNNQPMESKLAEAADKAQTLTDELRKNGIEAYVFHDRYESYVCVGSFPWATRKLSNGKDELNPEIEKVILQYKARIDSIGGQGYVRPKSIPSLAGKDIFFDIQPLPVLVPKLEKSTGILSLR